MPNFSTPEHVLKTIRAGDNTEQDRQGNRIKVTNAANCVPPLTKVEAKKMGVKINLDFGGLMDTLADARRQYLTAFWGNQHFFKVSLPFAPSEHQSEWEAFITQEINKPLRNSLPFFELHNSRWSSVVTHGVAPMTWDKPDHWLPRYRAMSDFRVATDTTLDFENLSWFAVRVPYKPGDLMEFVADKSKGNKWDRKTLYEILKQYKEINFVDPVTNYDFQTGAEKMQEMLRQSGAYYSGDAMPSIPLWHFYFEDNSDPDNKGWFMVVIPETGKAKTVEPKDFLWQDDKPVAPAWEQLMHCQFGDLAFDPPFKFHAVRSLGFALFEPHFYDNLTKCRFMQHVHDNFNILLRISDPSDRARAAVQEFSNLGVIKSGVSIVPENERHQVNGDLVEMALSLMEQIKSKASSSYTQQVDTGTKKEQTAFETNVKNQQVNAMLGGLLLKAFIYEGHADREIARRFCLDNSSDPDIQRFRRRCLEVAHIPPQFLRIDQWEVEPVTPLGMGNPTIAQAAAQQLLQMRPMFPPSAQQEILHESTLVVTQDARKAARWAPLGRGKDASAGGEYAQGIFGTLMQGVPLPPVERYNPIEVVEAMLPLFAGKIAQIEQRDNMARPEEVQGLQTVYQYLAGLVQRLAQDDAQKERAKKYMDALGQLMNQVKGLAQRGAEAQQKQAQTAQGGGNGELQAKAAEASLKQQIETAKAAQKLKHEDIAFRNEQKRKDLETVYNASRAGMMASQQPAANGKGKA